jgi:hypothetical protein
MIHYYDGKFHLLPKTFEFPQVGVFGAWRWFGDKAKGYPPLKRIRSHNLPHGGLSKTFSDWAMMMRHITRAITSAGIEIPNEITDTDAVELFRVGLSHLRLAPTSRKRRVAELSLSTALHLVRQAIQVRKE